MNRPIPRCIPCAFTWQAYSSEILHLVSRTALKEGVPALHLFCLCVSLQDGSGEVRLKVQSLKLSSSFDFTDAADSPESSGGEGQNEWRWLGQAGTAVCT